MDSSAGAAGLPIAWVLGALAAAGLGAAAVVLWQRRRQHARVGHYLFTPLPCTFELEIFEAPKSLFDVAWDIGASEPALDLLQELKLLPEAGPLDYAALNRTLDYFVRRLGSYRNFVYRCQAQLREHPHLLSWDVQQFEEPDGALTAYVATEERRLEPYVLDPMTALQNRMVAYLYDDAKTSLARKYGLALAFDYQSFQWLKRCNARAVQEAQDLLAFSNASAHDREMFWLKVKAAGSAGGVALLETVKAGGEAVAAGAGEAAAGVASEGAAELAGEVAGTLALSRLAEQFVPVLQAVVLAYGAVQVGRYVWRRSQKSSTWLRERKLRALQAKLSDRLDALYAKYEAMRDAQAPNAGPFAPAHELLALCEFEEQRLASLEAETPARTGAGERGLLRAAFVAHAREVSRGLSKGLGTHLRKLIRDTDAQLASGNRAAAALHLYLNKDLVFPPEVLADLKVDEIEDLIDQVAAEVKRLNAAPVS